MLFYIKLSFRGKKRELTKRIKFKKKKKLKLI